MTDTSGPAIRFGVIGIDHSHIFHQVDGLLDLGCTCAGYFATDDALPLDEFKERFPTLERVDDPRRLLEAPDVQLIVSAAVPGERAGIAVQAMRNGKDVMVDKPGVVSADQLEAVRETQARTGRIWSVNFSERFEVKAVGRALELVRAGAIGRVVQTLGVGPHRLGPKGRPAWFFDPARNGGILVDLASHQIDQFLAFTGAYDAEVAASTLGNLANPDYPGIDDFGEILLRGASVSGYLRVDWYTPGGLPVFGDGRLLILGDAGYIELRKYVDPAGQDGGNHLILVDHEGMRRVDCSDAPLPYYQALCRDIEDRTETAMAQRHPLRVFELALQAQAQAARLSAGSSR